jgi:hypothetical protein
MKFKDKSEPVPGVVRDHATVVFSKISIRAKICIMGFKFLCHQQENFAGCKKREHFFAALLENLVQKIYLLQNKSLAINFLTLRTGIMQQKSNML